MESIRFVIRLRYEKKYSQGMPALGYLLRHAESLHKSFLYMSEGDGIKSPILSLFHLASML